MSGETKESKETIGNDGQESKDTENIDKDNSLQIRNDKNISSSKNETETGRNLERNEEKQAIAKEKSEEPTKEMSKEPTKEKSKELTKEKSKEPTTEKSKEPTKDKSEEPTKEMSKEPTKEKSKEPTKEKSKKPTKEKSEEPTKDTIKESNKETSEKLTKETSKEANKEASKEASKEACKEMNRETSKEKKEEASKDMLPSQVLSDIQNTNITKDLQNKDYIKLRSMSPEGKNTFSPPTKLLSKFTDKKQSKHLDSFTRDSLDERLNTSTNKQDCSRRSSNTSENTKTDDTETDGYYNYSVEKLMKQKYLTEDSQESEECKRRTRTAATHRTIDNENPKTNCCRKNVFTMLGFTLGIMFIVAISAAILVLKPNSKQKHYHGESALPNEETAETYKKAAVVSASPICSKIGADILRMKGSAVDAAIATCLCIGVISKHSSGIGGGGFMLVYQRNKNVNDLPDRFDALDFRESAPGRATQEMFHGDKTRFGGKTIAVPGELKGLYKASRLYGKLPWNLLVEPSIYLARNGFGINTRLESIVNTKKLIINEDIGLRRIMFASNNEARPAGYILKDELLAKTLEKVRDNPNSFYNGSLAVKIAKDIQQVGGLVTLDDLASYRVKTRRIIRARFDNFNYFTIGAPTGGPVIAQILTILKSDHLRRKDVTTSNLDRVALTYHRIVEAMKFAFAKKTGEGDPDFSDKAAIYKLIDSMVNDTEGEIINRRIDNYATHDYSYYNPQYAPNYEYGTSHINVLAANGDAVSLTSSINDWFGSGYRSLETGIIYNNQMIDFSISPSTITPLLPLASANFIHSGKRPATSMSQIIMTNSKGDVRFIIGGAGGKKIIPAIALVLINKLWFHDTLEHAINRKRFYTTLFPNRLKVEKTDARDAALIALLRQKNHFITARDTLENSEVLGIFVRQDGEIHASTDVRRHSHSDGY